MARLRYRGLRIRAVRAGVPVSFPVLASGFAGVGVGEVPPIQPVGDVPVAIAAEARSSRRVGMNGRPMRAGVNPRRR